MEISFSVDMAKYVDVMAENGLERPPGVVYSLTDLANCQANRTDSYDVYQYKRQKRVELLCFLNCFHHHLIRRLIVYKIFHAGY